MWKHNNRSNSLFHNKYLESFLKHIWDFFLNLVYVSLWKKIIKTVLDSFIRRKYLDDKNFIIKYSCLVILNKHSALHTKIFCSINYIWLALSRLGSILLKIPWWTRKQKVLHLLFWTIQLTFWILFLDEEILKPQSFIKSLQRLFVVFSWWN